MNPIVKNNNKMRYKFGDIQNLTENGLISGTYAFDSTEWVLKIRTNTTNDNEKTLALFLYYDSNNWENKNWVCELDAKYKVLNQNANGKNWMKETNHLLSKDVRNWGYSLFIDWQELVSPDNGYLKNDSIVIEIDFDFKFYDFSKQIAGFTDIVVNVEDTDFHVNKGVLCAKSGYFYDLLINRELEGNMIRLDDIKASDFCHILASLNSFFGGVHESTFGELLRIASQFQVSSIHCKCEQFLITYTGIEVIGKIKYAQSYGYEKLMKTCIESLKSAEDIKLLNADILFSGLNEATKLRIMQRLLDFY